MAKISQRFETPNGRAVPRIPARIISHSSMFVGEGGTLDAHGSQGVGMQLMCDDGRTLWVQITHAELAELVQHSEDFAKSYPSKVQP